MYPIKKKMIYLARKQVEVEQSKRKFLKNTSQISFQNSTSLCYVPSMFDNFPVLGHANRMFIYSNPYCFPRKKILQTKPTKHSSQKFMSINHVFQNKLFIFLHK